MKTEKTIHLYYRIRLPAEKLGAWPSAAIVPNQPAHGPLRGPIFFFCCPAYTSSSRPKITNKKRADMADFTRAILTGDDCRTNTCSGRWPTEQKANADVGVPWPPSPLESHLAQALQYKQGHPACVIPQNDRCRKSFASRRSALSFQERDARKTSEHR